MKNIRTLALIACFVGGPAFSQQAPRIEIFGGYSWSEEPEPPNSSYSATNGWQAALKFNLTSRIGLVAEASGQYGTPRFTSPRAFNNYLILPDTSFSTHTFLFGPEVNAYRHGRVSINARALAGFARQGNPGSTEVVPGASAFPEVLRFNGSANYGFSAGAGGNVDVRLKGGFSWRVVQPEVLLTHFEGDWKPDYRASTGLVFSFGRVR